MDTATQTAGTNTTDTGTPASTDTLLTAAPAAAQTDGQTGQQQPPADATGTAPAEGQGEGTTKQPQGAPEQYADFALPEGMAFNEEVLGEFKDFAKERNLSQEDAQKFADMGAKLIQQSNAKTLAQVEAVQAQWVEATRTDKEFGGDKLDENIAVAKRALDTFGTPELSKMLAETKMGNHPEVIRYMVRVGKAISEDKLVAGTTRPTQTDTAKKLYSNSNMN